MIYGDNEVICKKSLDRAKKYYISLTIAKFRSNSSANRILKIKNAKQEMRIVQIRIPFKQITNEFALIWL